MNGSLLNVCCKLVLLVAMEQNICGATGDQEFQQHCVRQPAGGQSISEGRPGQQQRVPG